MPTGLDIVEEETKGENIHIFTATVKHVSHTHSTCKLGLSEAVIALTTAVDSHLISCAALVRLYESPRQHARDLSGLRVQ